MHNATLKRKCESRDTVTLITPFGVTTGVVLSFDDQEGTFLFKSKAQKPFRLYFIDVLFLQED